MPEAKQDFSQFVGEQENEDAFANMKILDADATVLEDPEGRKAVRDIV